MSFLTKLAKLPTDQKIRKIAQEAMGGNSEAEEILKEVIKVYHGSPHDFDKFMLDYIGTGEGAQRYGWGLYFTETESIAKGYRDTLSRGYDKITIDGKVLDQGPKDLRAMFPELKDAPPATASIIITALKNNNGSIDHAIQEIASRESSNKIFDAAIETLEKMRPMNVGIDKGAGKMYEVSIKTSVDDMLDWDKPLSQQSEKVLKTLKDNEDLIRKKLYLRDSLDFDEFLQAQNGGSFYKLLATELRGYKNATEFLNGLDMKGIRYDDGLSRGKEGGTSNYVVFDPRIIEIARKYGVALPVAASMLTAGLAPQEAQAGGLGLLDNLLKAGYPESVAKRIASGELPMDEASRMARAEAQGLSTDELLYHWTNRDFNEFVPSETGKYASGIYASPNKWYGEKYVESGTPKRMELLARGDIAEMSDIAEVEPIVRSRIQELKPQGSNFGHVYWSLINDELKKKGFSGLRMDNEVVVFDPSDIRSTNAAFDPEYTGPNIMGSRVIPTAGLLAAGAMAPEDAEAATGYKLFRQVDGKLYPLFVNRSTEVPMGEWLKAEAGELTPEGKVKSSLGPLAYRPGWHAGDLPIATHIGGKSGPVKAPNYRPNDQVWAEVEFPEDVDWQAIANANATRNKAGEIIPRTAQITDQVPYGGFYRYKTNPNMTGEWMIGGDMKVNRVLSDEEVQAINEASGVADLPRLQSIKDKTMLATPIAGAGLMAALAPDQVQAQELDPNLPLTIGSPKEEVNYETMPSYYDYGDGATIPVRPPEPVRETKPEYLPAGMPVNPYTFMMSQGATQGEAARAQAEAISEAGRGLANQIGGIGGEMETLGKGLLYALTGQAVGGSPFSRFMHVLNNYDPQLPNVKDVEQLPPVMPELYPLDEESRRIMNMFGGLISPL